jgi:hypothetical protein
LRNRIKLLERRRLEMLRDQEEESAIEFQFEALDELFIEATVANFIEHEQRVLRRVGELLSPVGEETSKSEPFMLEEHYCGERGIIGGRSDEERELVRAAVRRIVSLNIKKENEGLRKKGEGTNSTLESAGEKCQVDAIDNKVD